MNIYRNRYLFASDIVLLPIAIYLCFALRLDTLTLENYLQGFLLFTALSVPIMLLTFRLAMVYACDWRYASVEELTLLGKALLAASVLIGTLTLLASAWALSDLVLIPRSVPLLFIPFALLATLVPRLTLRHLALNHHRVPVATSATSILIMGAGDAGAMIAREIQRNPQLGMKIVGFADDDPSKQGMRIHTIPVLGTQHDIPQIVQKHGVQQVIIAIPTAPGKNIRAIVKICERAGVQTRIMPGIYELLDGKVSISQLREVQIEDLLRREPVRSDMSAVKNLIRGRRVLISGAGGSIGSELCRQVLHCEPAEIVLLGHGENSIFLIQQELLKCSGQTRIHAAIADIRFGRRIQSIFEQYRPDIVFHAAAHKHVPLMEHNPAEAITTNVLGTHNLLNAALAVGVERFVMISSDKAVNPTSIMGVSKRIAELLVHHAAQTSGRAYAAVRFGNVLGSRGSVVLTFKQQIAAGEPITVTHPEMTRFFMTIPEAVHLVLQASVLQHGGEVFMLDMGKPVKIVDLASDMIRLSGLEVGRDIDIIFSGIRPGEKLYEELFLPDEHYQATVHHKIFIATRASSAEPVDLQTCIDGLITAASNEDDASIYRLLYYLVPEFQPAPDSPAGCARPTLKPMPRKARLPVAAAQQLSLARAS